jgi:hypothetical protein
MSYDIRLVNDAGETLEAENPHTLTGGTYAMGGTSELWLNVTYNYGQHFYQVLGEKGIRRIYGMRAQDSIPLLTKAAQLLTDDVDPDYWKATEGNARKALLDLCALARMAPEGIWQGD